MIYRLSIGWLCLLLCSHPLAGDEPGAICADSSGPLGRHSAHLDPSEPAGETRRPPAADSATRQTRRNTPEEKPPMWPALAVLGIMVVLRVKLRHHWDVTRDRTA